MFCSCLVPSTSGPKYISAPSDQLHEITNKSTELSEAIAQLMPQSHIVLDVLFLFVCLFVCLVCLFVLAFLFVCFLGGFTIYCSQAIAMPNLSQGGLRSSPSGRKYLRLARSFCNKKSLQII